MSTTMKLKRIRSHFAATLASYRRLRIYDYKPNSHYNSVTDYKTLITVCSRSPLPSSPREYMCEYLLCFPCAMIYIGYLLLFIEVLVCENHQLKTVVRMKLDFVNKQNQALSIHQS